MGRDLHASSEVEGIIAYAEAVLDTPFYVSSTLRPGAITASGNPSRHSRALAVDLTAAHANGTPRPTIDSPELREIFEAFRPIAVHLNELIYADAPKNVKRGQWVAPYAMNIHHNHVHVAVDPGVDLRRYAPDERIALPVAPDSAEIITDTDGREDMAEPVDGMAAPEGGVWVLTRDGGVRAYGNAPFHGSYPGLPPEARMGERTFVDIAERDDGQPGYMIQGSDGSLYRFP